MKENVNYFLFHRVMYICYKGTSPISSHWRIKWISHICSFSSQIIPIVMLIEIRKLVHTRLIEVLHMFKFSSDLHQFNYCYLWSYKLPFFIETNYFYTYLLSSLISNVKFSQNVKFFSCDYFTNSNENSDGGFLKSLLSSGDVISKSCENPKCEHLPLLFEILVILPINFHESLNGYFSCNSTTVFCWAFGVRWMIWMILSNWSN